ncbi:MAG: hypothetical protein ROR55_04505 [Devosia sp.]
MRQVLVEAVPIWRATDDKVDTLLRAPDSTVLTKDLLAIAFGEPG